MKKFSRFISIIAFLLVVCIFVSAEPCQLACAAAGQDIALSKKYLSEVKMFYGTSESAAKTYCEQEGFIFCPTDLNEGAPNVIYPEGSSSLNNRIHIHMGYKLTDDPGDAITDLTLLDMKNTHYTELEYEKFLNDHVSDFKNEAAQMMVLVNELAKKLEAGSPNAQMAYDSLNLIYVDESKPHDAQDNLLGNYLINHDDITFFEKFIQRGNSMVLGRMTDVLCMAASDYNADGTTWVDRSKTSEVAIEYENATSETKSMYDQSFEDPAQQFIKAIRSFSDTYKEAKRRLDQYGDTLGYSELEGMTEENGTEKLADAGNDCRFPEYSDALKTYALLDAVQYQQAGETVVNNAALLAEPKEEATEAEGKGTGSVDNNSEKNTTVTYSSNKTFAQYIMELTSDEMLEDHPSVVYPIISAMTPAQRIVLKLGGFGALVECLHQTNDYSSKRSEATEDAMKHLRELGYTDGRVYLWSGMDKSLYSKKVVQTDAKKEAEAAGADLEASLSEAERRNNTSLQQALEIVDIVTNGFSAIVTIAEIFIGSTLWTLGTNTITAASATVAAGVATGTASSYVLGTVFCALHIINVVAFVVSVAMFIFNILQWAGVFNQVEKVDYTSLPEVVLDARRGEKGAYSVRYDTIPSNPSFQSFLDGSISLRDWQSEGQRANSTSSREDSNYTINLDNVSDKFAELTAFQGIRDRWLAMYYSKSPAAGEPIEVKPGQEPFVTKSDYQPPEGYRPLTLVVGDSAVDVNDVIVFGHKSSPLYVFIPGKVETRGTGDMVADDGRYVTSVRFSYSEDRQNAINVLKKDKYQYFETNLTPYQGYTFLGYQLGSEANALTDIRISNSSADAIVFGDARYARMGLNKKENKEASDVGSGTTPDGLSLFATMSKSAGSPIVSLSIEPKRLAQGNGKEPICLFSGGDAVDVGKNWSDNILNMHGEVEVGSAVLNHHDRAYEMVSEDDPENGLYLYFQPKEQFKSTDANGKPALRYIAGFSYFLAGDKETRDNRFGSNYEYMQTFAEKNGFELIRDGGEAFRVMTDEAGEMSMGLMWRDVGGYPADTYNFDMTHTIENGVLKADSDGGLVHDVGFKSGKLTWNTYSRNEPDYIYHTAMYFGVAYTYNPYRAITGISGLITPYTEKNDQIKYSGMTTPAGTFQACSVSIQGCPINSAGITLGYYNPVTMRIPLYTNYEAGQHSDLSWTTDKDMEVLSHYLMTSGPRDGVLPLMEGDIAFSTSQNPGTMEGYVPLCDLRTPGDYEHPMNLALDTTNKGSKYLYLYLKNTAGGREGDKSFTNAYKAKKYVAAVFCGVGKTPEAAIANLYSNAKNSWQSIAGSHKDISETPMVTEFDEIIPIDLSSEHPWYTLHLNDTNVKSLKNGEWVRGNELAYYRWDGHVEEWKIAADDYEKDWKCAYVGVVRTAYKKNVVYGMLKYYTDAKTGSDNLTCGGEKGSTECTLAGGPVDSAEGKYYLYYTTNSGTAGYRAPATGLEISDDIFVNGYNTAFTVKESDRTNNELPQFAQLRMRTDEYKYIHLGYERVELPYYEQLYLGVGNSKNEAYVDMVSSTNAYAAMDVDCNYNSFSKKWIAIGYRRTSKLKDSIRDVFLYSGDNPPDKIRVDGGYMPGKDEEGKPAYVKYADKTGEGVQYKLLKHNLKTGSEVLSLNDGNGGKGLYLYYTTSTFCSDKSAEYEVTPITNICFTYGDISPRYATAKQLATVFERSYYAKTQINASAYENPIWECVLGVKGSPLNWKASGEGASRFSLNEGVRPGLDGNGWKGSDSRVYMFVDRADNNPEVKVVYQVRKNAKLPEFGYYSAESTFGYLKQVD